jgi:hypothetical protein
MLVVWLSVRWTFAHERHGVAVGQALVGAPSEAYGQTYGERRQIEEICVAECRSCRRCWAPQLPVRPPIPRERSKMEFLAFHREETAETARNDHLLEGL